MSQSEPDAVARLASMTPEVREIYEALIAPTTVYQDARHRYEAIRSRVIAEAGYDVFRLRQTEAFRQIWASRRSP